MQVRPEDWEVVYRTRPCLPLKSTPKLALEGLMAGGRMVYVGGHRIVLGSGDYHWDGLYAPDALAQKDEADYGKILEIDLRAKSARTVAKGVRNVQGVTLDRLGQIWTVEHGVRGGDELNRLVDGANYGWPEVTLGTRYNELPWPTSGPYGRHDGFDSPVFAWLPSVATSSITLIDGFDPAWDGDLLVATLKGSMLIRLRVEDNHVVFAEPIPIGLRIRDVHMHADGRIVLWTDAHRLIFISPDTATPVSLLIDTFVAGMNVDEERRQRLSSAVSACEECHSFDATESTTAPSLGKVYGYPIGSTGYANGSAALKTRRGEWNEESLMAFLSDPQAFAPGCLMPAPGLAPETISDLTEVLRVIAAPR
jgi:cytochrome c2